MRLHVLRVFWLKAGEPLSTVFVIQAQLSCRACVGRLQAAYWRLPAPTLYSNLTRTLQANRRASKEKVRRAA